MTPCIASTESCAGLVLPLALVKLDNEYCASGASALNPMHWQF